MSLASLFHRLPGIDTGVNTPPLDPATAFDLLSSWRRRDLLTLLADRDGPVELGELTREIAMRENGHTHPDDVTDQQRKRVYVALYQTHIPVLEDAGAVETEEAVVHSTEATEVLAETVEDVHSRFGGGA